MPNERNFYFKEVDGKLIEEPLLVTISLEEYRSLVRENTMFKKRIEYLECRLIEEVEKRLKDGETDGKPEQNH